MQNYANEKIIFSRRVKQGLKEYGFKPIKTIPNYLNPGWVCWVYYDTPDFQDALSKLVGSHEGRSSHE